MKLESLKLASLNLESFRWEGYVKLERTRYRKVLDGKAQNEIGKNEVSK